MKKILLRTVITVATLLGILAIAGYALLVPRPLVPPETISNLTELESYLQDLTGHNADSPPGLSLVVVKDGEIAYQEGFGLADGPRNIPATSETVYNYWSMTKIVTAVAVFQLQERDLLSIDDPVSDYLPFFDVEYPSSSSATITLRHLLNHSSGLPNNVPEILSWIHTDGGAEWNQTELIRAKFSDYATLAFEPGTRAVYTNVGYMVLAAVIEAASGQSYEQFVKEHILQPLSMDQTGFTYTASMTEAEATGAHPRIDIQSLLLLLLGIDANRLVRETHDGIMWFNHIYSDQNGPTGLIGPPTELARLLIAYLNQGELDGTTHSVQKVCCHHDQRESCESWKLTGSCRFCRDASRFRLVRHTHRHANR